MKTKRFKKVSLIILVSFLALFFVLSTAVLSFRLIAKPVFMLETHVEQAIGHVKNIETQTNTMNHKAITVVDELGFTYSVYSRTPNVNSIIDIFSLYSKVESNFLECYHDYILNEVDAQMEAEYDFKFQREDKLLLADKDSILREFYNIYGYSYHKVYVPDVSSKEEFKVAIENCKKFREKAMQLDIYKLYQNSEWVIYIHEENTDEFIGRIDSDGVFRTIDELALKNAQHCYGDDIELVEKVFFSTKEFDGFSDKEYTELSEDEASEISSIPVYKFYDPSYDFYFYTTDQLDPSVPHDFNTSDYIAKLQIFLDALGNELEKKYELTEISFEYTIPDHYSIFTNPNWYCTTGCELNSEVYLSVKREIWDSFHKKQSESDVFKIDIR